MMMNPIKYGLILTALWSFLVWWMTKAAGSFQWMSAPVMK